MPALSEGEVLVQSDGTAFGQNITIGGPRAQQLRADEPKAVGGDATGPTPVEYATGAGIDPSVSEVARKMAGLGACESMTLQMYARRRGLAINAVTVRLWEAQTPEGESSIHATIAARMDRQALRELSDDQKERLVRITEKCPVRKLLEPDVNIETDLVFET
jgi:putative redox protein